MRLNDRKSDLEKKVAMSKLRLFAAMTVLVCGCGSASEVGDSFAGVDEVRQAELRSGPESIAVRIAEVSARFPGDTALVMWLGRPFIERDFSSTARASIILSRPLWERLGGRPGLVGRTVELDGSPRVVLGVLADNPAFEARAAGAVPIQPDR